MFHLIISSYFWIFLGLCNKKHPLIKPFLLDKDNSRSYFFLENQKVNDLLGIMELLVVDKWDYLKPVILATKLSILFNTIS